MHGRGLSGRERRVVARRCARIDRAGHEDQIAGSSGARDRLGRPKGQGDVSVSGEERQGERTGHRGIETWRCSTILYANVFRYFDSVFFRESWLSFLFLY